jgi:hypothetical protein
MEGVELTKESTLIVEIHQETPLNIDLGINKERQDCKIGTMWGGEVLVGERRGNGGDKGEGIWLLDFIYVYEIEQ